jgi:hypothetical protein
MAGTSQGRAGRRREIAVAVGAQKQAKADGCGMGVAVASHDALRGSHLKEVSDKLQDSL